MSRFARLQEVSLRFDDMPVPAGQRGMNSRNSQHTIPWRDQFNDPVPPVRPQRMRPAASNFDEPVSHGRTHRVRHAASNHTGVAAVTAAVMGVGISAGMFGFALFALPSAAPSGAIAALPAQAPQAVTIAGTGGSASHHTGYTGKHRKPAQAPPAHHLHPSAGLPSAAASTSLPAGTPSAARSATAPAPSSSSSPAPSPRSSSPTPGGSGTSTQSGGGHSSGGTGSQGGDGGLLGGLTGLLGSLTKSL
jgi:hypothetical protein